MGTGKMHNGAREHVGLSLLEDVVNSLEWNPCSRGWTFRWRTSLALIRHVTNPSIRKTWRSFRPNRVDQAGVGY